jgi:hypothetical protein
MRCVAFWVFVMASSAGAQVLSSPGRLWLTGGGAYRDHQQLAPEGTLGLRIGGTERAIAPTTIHFSGAYFFNSFLGANLEARSELFFARQRATVAVAQPGAELTLSAAGRWLPASWISLEGQLGWGLQLRSVIVAGPAQRLVPFTGPSLGVAVGLSPSRWFVSQLFFRVQPAAIALSSTPGFGGYALAGGAQLSVGALRIGDVQVGAAVTLEASTTRLQSDEGVAQQVGVRLGLGLSLMRAPVDPVVVAIREGERQAMPKLPEVKRATGPGRIRGVVWGEGKPVAGAVVRVGEKRVVADAEGRFVVAEVGPGPVTMQVQAAGFKDAEEVAQVPPEAEAELDFALVLKAVEARATLRGLIRAKSGETLKATVRVVERKLKLQVKADGRFSAEVPSGKYTLIIEARGYVTQTKTVEVSGGDQAIFHAELERTR